MILISNIYTKCLIKPVMRCYKCCQILVNSDMYWSVYRCTMLPLTDEINFISRKLFQNCNFKSKRRMLCSCVGIHDLRLTVF